MVLSPIELMRSYDGLNRLTESDAPSGVYDGLDGGPSFTRAGSATQSYYQVLGR